MSHTLCDLSGRIQIKMDDGQEEEIGPGDVAFIRSRHDASVIGNDACRLIDFGELSEYEMRRG